VLLPPPSAPPEAAVVAAVLFCLRGPTLRPSDPWARRDGWRLNAPNAPQIVTLRAGEETLSVSATASGSRWELAFGARRLLAEARFVPDGGAVLTLGGVQSRAVVLDHGDDIAVFADGAGWRFTRVDALASPAGADASVGRLSAPMPGRVVQLLVAVGDAVRQGQPLIVVEAMKMEHTIAAPRDGTVEAVRYAVGDLVEEGAELIALAEDA
jgi:3-methylcrotonyl-CoA carboxylase alpha subunit